MREEHSKLQAERPEARFKRVNIAGGSSKDARIHTSRIGW